MDIYNPSAIGVTAGFGIPTGGTSGQVLQKVDGTNYNTQWASSAVPTGGTTGQILRKVDGTNYNTQWYGLSYASILFNELQTGANLDITPVLSTANGITVAGNTIVISQPGIYSLFASLPYRLSGYVEYRWVDASNAQLVGTNVGIGSPSNANDPITSSPAAGIVNITSPNTIIKLRTGNLGGVGTQVPGYAIATITQLR